MGWFRQKERSVVEAGPAPASDERVYAVGDVHGRVDLFLALLHQLTADATARSGDGRQARLVLLGDYIDRGDQSRDVLEAIMRLRAAPGLFTLDCLMGNHEAALLSFLAEPARGVDWLSFGGAQTLASYGVRPPRVSDVESVRAAAETLAARMGPHLALLRNGLHRMAQSGSIVFAHAGLDPSLPLDAQTDDALFWGRSAFLESRDDCGRLVVHGHFDADQPVVMATRICVDTGAYYSGRLTAVCLDDDVRFLST